MNDITPRVIQVMSARSGMPTAELGTETELTALDLDSLSLMEIGFDLEREFDVPLDDGRVAAANTLGDLVAAVEDRVPQP
ncbi:acyl carrier protein [Streptomyces sp. NPDC058623]|uniref:acyl carrier protein n=1 Tax=Streptomyces sp. NPDC058623 TaxID=3346563 RepID=UPI00364EACF6